MEYQIQKTIFSVHELIVEKELFNEKKEYEAWLKPGSEDLQDMVRVLHSRQIGNQKFEICRTVDTDGELIEVKEETNLETEVQVKAFKNAWKFSMPGKWESGCMATDPYSRWIIII